MAIHLTGSVTKKSLLSFVITWTETSGETIKDEIEFYGIAQLRHSKPDKKASSTAVFKANGRNCTSVSAKADLLHWHELWGEDRAFVNDDWTFDVSYALMFNDPTQGKINSKHR